jgi:hypothetical protein
MTYSVTRRFSGLSDIDSFAALADKGYGKNK